MSRERALAEQLLSQVQDRQLRTGETVDGLADKVDVLFGLVVSNPEANNVTPAVLERISER